MARTVSLPDTMDVYAPDGSEIRLLVATAQSSMVHCLLPPRATTQAVSHRTVEELWYCMAGRGQLWRRDVQGESVASLQPGVSVDIPTGTAFQFRNVGEDDLVILIVTTPPWPGADEAVPCEGRWAVSEQSTDQEV